MYWLCTLSFLVEPLIARHFNSQSGITFNICVNSIVFIPPNPQAKNNCLYFSLKVNIVVFFFPKNYLQTKKRIHCLYLPVNYKDLTPLYSSNRMKQSHSLNPLVSSLRVNFNLRGNLIPLYPQGKYFIETWKIVKMQEW